MSLTLRRANRIAIAAALVVAPLLAVSAGAQPATQPTTAPATAPAATPTGFDPAKHMRTSEVRPGMKGFGLTVLSGTEIQRFEVETISVLHNQFGPQQDVVMIRCLDDFMKHTGPIQGCSGSPIYLYDESGRARMIGAYAYGFNLVKDPIIGVQPIESMLSLPVPNGEQIREAIGGERGDSNAAAGAMSVSMIERGWVPQLSRKHAAKPELNDETTLRGLTVDGQRLAPLATPLAISGVSQRVADAVGPMLKRSGFTPMLAAAAHSDASAATASIQPGSVLAAQMLGGDMELTAVGTTTEVIDGRAFGFGHPFNGEGATSIPMGAGQVHLVMPLLTASFKLGSIGAVSGAIDMDGQFGIAGNIGSVPTTIPVTIEVNDLSSGTTRTYRYQSAKHRTYTPDLVAMAMQASILAERSLPLENTIDYTVDLAFAGGRRIQMNEVATSNDGFNVISESSVPIVAFTNNPFETVPLESVSAKVTIKSGVEQLDIQTASPAKSKYEPGETVRINVRLRDAKGVASMKAIDVKLPESMPAGDHVITVADGPSNLELEATTRAYRFTVRNVDELYEGLKNLTSLGRSDAFYVRLPDGKSGVTIGRTPLPTMPPSRRAILTAAARPDAGETATTETIVVPMNRAIRGKAEVTIHVAKRLP